MTKIFVTAVFVILHSLDEPNREWIAVEFPITCLNRGNDHQHQIQNVEDGEDHKTNQNQTEDASDNVVD